MCWQFEGPLGVHFARQIPYHEPGAVPAMMMVVVAPAPSAVVVAPAPSAVAVMRHSCFMSNLSSISPKGIFFSAV